MLNQFFFSAAYQNVAAPPSCFAPFELAEVQVALIYCSVVGLILNALLQLSACQTNHSRLVVISSGLISSCIFCRPVHLNPRRDGIAHGVKHTFDLERAPSHLSRPPRVSQSIQSEDYRLEGRREGAWCARRRHRAVNKRKRTLPH